MTSVFLSYDREDVRRAGPIAAALEKAGHSVWWDRRIKSGAQFGREIDQALKRADAVVVLWSKKSIDSAWVCDEAAAGRDSGKLVPARIDPVEPPLGFRQYQTTDLTRWKGRRTAEFADLLEAIASLCEKEPEATEPIAVPSGETARRFRRTLLLALALVAAVAVGLLAWNLIGRSSSDPVVAVRPADSSPASQALARDLFVKLGSLQTARPNSIDLISHDEAGKRPDFTFQVGRSDGGRAEANLALVGGSDRSLLWAQAFRDPRGNEADLRQQLSYTAADVLGCALEGTAGRLTRQQLKTYLTACAPLPDAGPGGAAALVADLQQLVREAPRFAGGWAKLLLAETAILVDPSRLEGAAVRPALVRHIAQARKFNPDLAEAYIAEYSLTPAAKLLERSRILDQAIERNADSPELRAARAKFLQSVGRMDDALQDARRGVELDPLSPVMRDDHIVSLAFAGRLDEAFAELGEAERLWPGSTSLLDTRYVLHLRLGDPTEALRLLRAGVLEGTPTHWLRLQESFLHARIDRSPEKVDSAIREARTSYDHVPTAITGLSQTLVEFNRQDELFQILLNWRRMDILDAVIDVLFRPQFSDFHADPRFMQVAKHLGLLDFWRTTGKWPDFCSTRDLPYGCTREAAKLAA